MLLYLFNPMLRSLRALQQASELEKVQKDFNRANKGGKQVSLADLIVIGEASTSGQGKGSGRPPGMF